MYVSHSLLLDAPRSSLCVVRLVFESVAVFVVGTRNAAQAILAAPVDIRKISEMQSNICKELVQM